MFAEKKVFIKDLEIGEVATIPLFVADKSVRQTKRGAPYLSLMLVDSSGRISGKAWDNTEHLDNKLVKGRVSIVVGQVGTYQDERQITVSSATLVAEGDYDPTDYQESSPKPIDPMAEALLKLARGIADPDYRRLTLEALASPEAQDFWSMPAAKGFHHAYLGGLLEHTLSVARLARHCAKHYGPMLDPSLLMAGAILHDIGKIWEFTKGPGTDYSTEGRLLGHLCIGSFFITEVARRIPGFPEEKLTLMRHMLLSHHGEFSMGTAQTPKILEAIVLHHIDNLDGKLAGIHAFIDRETQPRADGTRPEWTSYFKLLDSYYMRTPGVWEGGKATDQTAQAKEPQARLKEEAVAPGQPAQQRAGMDAFGWAPPGPEPVPPAIGNLARMEDPGPQPTPEPGPAPQGATAAETGPGPPAEPAGPQKGPAPAPPKTLF